VARLRCFSDDVRSPSAPTTRPDPFLLFSRSRINGSRSTSSVSLFSCSALTRSDFGPQPNPLDLSLSLSLYLILSGIDPRSQPACRFAPMRFHLPVFLLSAAQFGVPGQHQTNLLGQPRFSSRPMAETVSAHNRIPRPRTHLHAAHPPPPPESPRALLLAKPQASVSL
jgi:hypothetical protein